MFLILFYDAYKLFFQQTWLSQCLLKKQMKQRRSELLYSQEKFPNEKYFIARNIAEVISALHPENKKK